MGDGEANVTRIEMPDGTPVWARISGAEELSRPSGGLVYSDTGFADQVQARVESLQGVVTSVARSLVGPLRAVRPDEVSIEFGIELTAKSGKVVGLLADGEAKGGIKVTLTWTGGGPPADLSAPPLVPPQAQPHAGTHSGTHSGTHAGTQRPAAPPPPAVPPVPPSARPPVPPSSVPPVPPSAGPPSHGRTPGGASPGAPAHPDGFTPPAGSGA
ncbi:CU044_2847 family protein [Streptomyces sp. NPDC059255]|uniref:CU044_2847 family protein n=1 Tax=Streptomyces sp. NPDC059255 TaxID=3346793 RepID=UPI0036B5448D